VTIRALLADDEPHARRILREFLERTDDVRVIAECATGEEALAGIRREAPDVAFLDIRMPGISGLDVAAALEPEASPHIVFVTAYDEYAVRAFTVNALHYVLKPIDEERLTAALTRARHAVRAFRERQLSRRTTSAVAETPRSARAATELSLPRRLLVRSGEGLKVIAVEEIDWVEASGDYVSIHAGKKAWLLRAAIGDLAERYATQGIVRIHRSTLVNLNRVTELRPLAYGDLTVVLRDGTELKMSRHYRDAFEALGGNSE
jgi:two-component system, LytTR family, response regulator